MGKKLTDILKIGVTTTALFLSLSTAIAQDSETPTYSAISFGDNICFNTYTSMKHNAFIEFEDKVIQLDDAFDGDGYHCFNIPRGVFEYQGSFIAYIIDPNGNVSSDQKLFSYDGAIFETNPLERDLLSGPKYNWIAQDMVSFNDNVAPGMKAYLVLGSSVLELNPIESRADRQTFYLPESMEDGKYFVFAVDRDGNPTELIEFYVLDGMVMEDSPEGYDTSIAPELVELTSSYGSVVFADNMTPGMRAYFTQNDKRSELPVQDSVFNGYDQLKFKLPDEIQDGKFTVYAIDRDGNESEHYEFFVIEGQVFDYDILNSYDTAVPPEIDFIGHGRICFNDNMAFGMKAYADIEGELTELESADSIFNGIGLQYFRIPESILEDQETFRIFAIDRDGNHSRTYTINVVDGTMNLS